MERVKRKLDLIGEAIREKTGKDELLKLDEMPDEILAIETGIQTNDADAAAADILEGKTAYVKDVKITGTIPTKTSNDLSVKGASVTVPSGYYKEQTTKSVATATQATPSIGVDSDGLITASATQDEGYVVSGTKSATKQLTTKSAATITPGTSNKTIAAGTYLTGAQTIAGDADLKAANIKKGVNIFGVDGSYDAVELNFKVVGGTTQPSSTTENTIWVNTSTSITSYVFSATQPTGSTGMVWISTGTSSSVGFNALKKNGILVYPISAKQYINGWVDKTTKIYQGGEWVDWWRGELYKNGNTYDGITGGWKKTVATNGTVTFNSTSIKVSIDRNANGATFVGPKNAIDLTNYNTLSINVTDFYSVNSIITMYVNPTSIVSASDNTAGVSLNKKGIISLDVSELEGFYYIGVGGGWFTPCSATFNEVMLS